MARNDKKRLLATESNNADVLRSKESYRSKMIAALGCSKALDDDEMRQLHQNQKCKVVESFLQELRPGGREYSESFKARLEDVRPYSIWL